MSPLTVSETALPDQERRRRKNRSCPQELRRQTDQPSAERRVSLVAPPSQLVLEDGDADDLP
ncbi:MAG: hypothetical protein MHM6MM_006688 [Cercozoa sp. M6MM]